MSTVKSKKLQVGTDASASNNFTIYQPATPDGTLRIGVGNADSPTEIARFTSSGITSTLSTSDVLTANAGLTYGDVGTYALLANESGTSQLTPGSTLAGSSLSAANTYASGTSSGRSNYVPSGTWRLCGQTGYFNDTSTATVADLRISLWVRIS